MLGTDFFYRDSSTKYKFFSENFRNIPISVFYLDTKNRSRLNLSGSLPLFNLHFLSVYDREFQNATIGMERQHNAAPVFNQILVKQSIQGFTF